MRIEIQAFGETELSREILTLGRRAEDPLPALNAVHEHFLKLEEEQFDTEGAAGADGSWAPLAPSTVARKAAAGLDPRILHATLELRKSLSESSDGNHVYRPTPDGAFMGSAVPYGVFHQSREPRHRLPRRPPVSLSEEDKVEWIKIVQRWLVSGVA